MKIPYFCCIGAELKRYAKDFDFMNQVYLYKVPVDDTIEEVFAQDYFKAISDTVLQDDILYVYETTGQMLHSCRFDKANGHITAVPLASDIPELEPDRILVSDQDGKISAGDLSLEYIKDTLSILHCTATLSGTVDTTTVVMLDELEAFANLDSRPSYKAAGALVIDENGNRGIIESVDTANETATIVTTFAYNAVVKDSAETQIMQGGLQTPELETDSLIVNGAATFEEAPITNDTSTFAATSEDSLIRKAQVTEVKTDLEGKIDQAATSGKVIGSFWFGKTKAATTVPAPTIIGQNYYDFTTGNWYETTDGATWTLGGTITPPTGIDVQILITSLFWDIIEIDNQHGGKGFWSHTNSTWSYFPNIYEQPQAGSGVNVGDRFITTRLDNELNGAVECNGATYNASDVNDGENNIIQLLTDGKLDYISMAAYAAEITANGFCKHIGWDGTGSDTFRVPTLTPHIVQKNNIPVIGNGMTLGLTNGTDNAGTVWVSGAALDTKKTQYGQPVSSASQSSSDGIAGVIGVTTDGTKSGIIADLTDVATTERVMIQLFNGATDEAVATCTGVLADVAGVKQNKVTKGHEVIEFQEPTAENNYAWYRLYADGWLEQGGTTSNSGNVTFTLEFSNTNYQIVGNAISTSDRFAAFNNKTTTGASIKRYGGNAEISWHAMGMAAE